MTRILCASPDCYERFPEPLPRRQDWLFPAYCERHCSVIHLDGNQPPAVARWDEGPICESCARALAMLGNEVYALEESR